MTKGQTGHRFAAVLTLGAAWGVFEATAGFALHLLPARVGAYLWFPAAYWFMDRAYRATGRRQDIVWVALISAAVKLCNLLTQVRADFVINPAVAIVLEALAMAAFGIPSSSAGKRIALSAAASNTAWRALYLLYLALIAPGWMRAASVLSDTVSLAGFLLAENLIGSAVAIAAVCVIRPKRRAPGNSFLSCAAAGGLLAASVALQFIL